GNLRRGVLLPLRDDRHVVPIALDLIRDHLHFFIYFVIPASHEPLDREDRVLRIGNGLPLRHLPNQPLPSLRKADDRRSSPPTFFIRNHLGFAAFHHRDHRVRGPQVNSNNLAHIRSSWTSISALKSCA